MAYTTVNKSTAHFNTKLYTGNAGTQAITGIGFQPDLIWTKARNSVSSNLWYDPVRGVHKYIRSDKTNAEGTATNTLISFDSDGFTVGDGDNGNASGANGVAWNWKAGGAGSANTDGSINSTVSANTTAGFSIVTYTGTGANATVGHGLGTAPKFIVTKCRSDTSDWMVYYGDATDFLKLNTTVATEDLSTVWNDTSPTNTVFSLGNNGDVNTNGRTMVAYCFAEKTGYSKFGSYTGNGSTDGTFVYTGFKPAWFMTKKINADGEAWNIQDNTRSLINPVTNELIANGNNAEYTSGSRGDFLSNGFKLRTTSGGYNNNSSTYVYMAFGQSIVGSNNIPATAR